MRNAALRVQLAGMAAAAVVVTALIPQAFPDAPAGSAHGPETPIPGLTVAPLEAKARAALPSAVVSTYRWSSNSDSKSTNLDNSQDSDPKRNGGVSITFNPDGTVWMVSCRAQTDVPQDNVALAFCTGLPYTGANPAAIGPWVKDFFGKQVVGSSLTQNRSGAYWSLAISRYGTGPLSYRINVQPATHSD